METNKRDAGAGRGFVNPKLVKEKEPLPDWAKQEIDDAAARKKAEKEYDRVSTAGTALKRGGMVRRGYGKARGG